MSLRCQRCHRVLKDEASVAAGYGPSCYRKLFGKSLPGGEGRKRTYRPVRTPSRRKGEKQKATASAKVPALPPLFQEDIRLSRDETGMALANIPQRITVHSPEGFNWGYAGSGPADLALNILAVFIGEERAEPLYQQFKSDFLVNMPHEGGVIQKEHIMKWVEEHEKTKEKKAVSTR